MGVRSHLFPLLTIAFYKWSIRNRISLEFWDILQYFVLLWPSLRDRQISCPKLKLIKSLVCYGLQPNLSCGFHQHIRNSQLWRQRRILCIWNARSNVHATLYFARLYSCFHQSGKLFELQEKQNSFREHVHPFIHSRFSCIMISFLIWWQ